MSHPLGDLGAMCALHL